MKWRPSFLPKSSSGFSLIELMVVAALIGILASLFYIGVPQYITRARDAKRKADLHEYDVAFQTYFTDKHTFPPATILDSQADCGSTNLDPYLPKMLCDPTTRQPYKYVVSSDGLRYWLYANLVDNSDPIISNRGCTTGCGPDDDSSGAGDYNYGISSVQAVTGQFVDHTSTPPNCPQGCIPNSCGTCCPGAHNRCSQSGQACYSDVSC